MKTVYFLTPGNTLTVPEVTVLSDGSFTHDSAALMRKLLSTYQWRRYETPEVVVFTKD